MEMRWEKVGRDALPVTTLPGGVVMSSTPPQLQLTLTTTIDDGKSESDKKS